MPAHITDSRFLKDLYSTEARRVAFDDMHLLAPEMNDELVLDKSFHTAKTDKENAECH